ncbi:ORF6N domain-containing protein [Massilia sp. MB5]|uniref:ORF6N domain-containing protein n=1 Tax=Massilia sp. MB5 TaxID=2919578 RepID=UPI001F0E7257|nr:ORF6N domain-containing protein [Massilia sp. MB5]UMR31511.1 ORF6N domain-containing protein [Massilia sp. MB5]
MRSESHTLGEHADLPPLDTITQRIILLRGQKVLVDADLATLYAIPTKRFNEQVKRNIRRFPPDFMFQLQEDEFAVLRSHFATSNVSSERRGGRRYLPFCFTEHGAIMAAMVMNSPRAIEVSVCVVRAFVQLREWMASNQELALKLNELERRTDLAIQRQHHFEHETYRQIQQILEAIRELMAPPPLEKKRPIGFITPEDKT